MNYYTVLTNEGLARFARAAAMGERHPITQFALGDGNGADIAPDAAAASLAREVYRADISSVRPEALNKNWVAVEMTVPAHIGGWSVREAAVFDADGIMLAIASVPETYKPVLAQGSARELVLRMLVEIANAESVVLQIDPAVVLASQDYVTSLVAQHEAKPGPHPQYRLRRPAFDYYRCQL